MLRLLEFSTREITKFAFGHRFGFWLLPLLLSVTVQIQVMSMKQQSFVKYDLNPPEEEATPESLKIMACTWNMQGTIASEEYLYDFFNSPGFTSMPDIIFLGTQECEISLFWAFFCDSKARWEEAIRRHLPKYEMLSTYTLQGLHSTVLILRRHVQNIFVINREVLRAGFCCHLFGNKGAVEIKIKAYGQYLQFINCHLAPHQNGSPQRNEILMKILDNMVCNNTITEVILLGDFNYRLEIKNEEYFKMLDGKKHNTQKTMRYSNMFEKEQLHNQKQLKERFLLEFREGVITFPPTYKLGEQSDEYCRIRVPGWTDRIFYRKDSRIRQKNYECLYDNYGSDHRPVFATFTLNVEEGLSLFEQESLIERSKCNLM